MVFDLPCFLWTKIYIIDLTGQLTSNVISSLTIIFFAFCIYPQCYMNNDLNLGLFIKWRYSMNNICQGYNIQKIIPFLPSLSLPYCQIGSPFCDKILLNNACFLTTSMCKKVKTKFKNPQKNKVCNDRFSIFLMAVKPRHI